MSILYIYKTTRGQIGETETGKCTLTYAGSSLFTWNVLSVLTVFYFDWHLAYLLQWVFLTFLQVVFEYFSEQCIHLNDTMCLGYSQRPISPEKKLKKNPTSWEPQK